MNQIKSAVRDVPNFPKPGIIFKDITPVLGDPQLFAQVIDAFVQKWRGEKISKVAGIESRGFLFAAPLAYLLKAGCVPIRKKGKLPHTTARETYDLEYGTDCVEMHVDAVQQGERVLLIDDLLATGGTAGAAIRLLTKQGAQVVGCSFLIELAFLKGASRLGQEVHALLRYDS